MKVRIVSAALSNLNTPFSGLLGHQCGRKLLVLILVNGIIYAHLLDKTQGQWYLALACRQVGIRRFILYVNQTFIYYSTK
jgi:hypothetical protein